jgi:ABC-type glycerol-3-phosphate transport system permease component
MTGFLIIACLLAVICGLTWLSRHSRVAAKIILYFFLLLWRPSWCCPSTGCSSWRPGIPPRYSVFPPPFWFGGAFAANFQAMNESVNLLGSFGNSLFVSVANTALVLLFCSMGGYAFAIYRFPGQKALFAILMGTMMVPAMAGIIPWFILISRLGWINNPAALIIPGCANAFGIFWMRQYCQNNVPVSLMEAAKIDGCPEWSIFFRVIAPVLLPAYAALGIMQFVNTWNDFMVPMLVLRDSARYTLPLMLSYMKGDPTRGTNVGALMMASAFSVLPLLVAFLCASKFFMSGLTAGAIKE